MPIDIQQSINNPDNIIVTGLSDKSRLYMFNVIKDDTSNYYFNIFKNYTMPDDFKNNGRFFDTYTVDNNDWWDNIAAHWYDTSELWLLVCFTNDIVNPFEEIYPGKIIKIFKREYYNVIIQNLKEIYKL